MKSIIFTVLALAGIFTAKAENRLVRGLETNQVAATAYRADQYQASLSQDNGGKLKFSPVEDKTIADPSTILGKVPAAIEENIRQDNEVTEAKFYYHGTLLYIERPVEDQITADLAVTDTKLSDEVAPIYLDKTTEDVIAEDNSIIDAQPESAQPLDFSKIDSQPMALQSKKIIGMN